MSPSRDDPIGALVGLSRAVGDAEDPSVIPQLLADVAAEHLGPVAIAVFATSESSDLGRVELRGCTDAQIERPDVLDPDSWRGVFERVPGVRRVEGFPLLSGGGMFGVLLVGWRDEPLPASLTLASGLAEVAAIGLDRAFRTYELHRTIDELDRRRTEWARSETLRQLGQMSAVVAHEVKNPLASMSGVMQVLRARFADGSQEKDILSKLLERVAELSRMVDELLAFARPRTPSWTTVPIGPLLSEVAATVRQDEAYREVRIRVEAADGSVRADRGMLQRLLLNLALNAAQATDGRGTVVLSTRAVRDGVELAVSDDGPGVPPELVEKVFEPFVTTRTRGSGLGLAIARQVAEAHGGALEYRTAELGGACFAVRLPLPQA